jgi:hypothetical protein
MKVIDSICLSAKGQIIFPVTVQPSPLFELDYARHQKTQPPHQNLPRLRAAVCLAEEVGAGLG